eukprot:TRINITY_DN9045_c0_g1_i1.p1 TRINITY_DN9045_c0_g1~~TRINITY_DN9045_c0_g1_i1.p1  ORF type:complete len:181 (-),score=24.07 TRINITY_DN9045_c0_g1_i1:420-962(-)
MKQSVCLQRKRSRLNMSRATRDKTTNTIESSRDDDNTLLIEQLRSHSSNNSKKKRGNQDAAFAESFDYAPSKSVEQALTEPKQILQCNTSTQTSATSNLIELLQSTSLKHSSIPEQGRRILKYKRTVAKLAEMVRIAKEHIADLDRSYAEEADNLKKELKYYKKNSEEYKREAQMLGVIF